MSTPRIDEQLLQNIWRQIHHLCPRLALAGGGTVRVINPGTPNPHAGPDFLNAHLEINGVTWHGNVEIHLRASDWDRHGHGADPAYNSVILHVVIDNDRAVRTADGQRVQAAEIPNIETLQEQLRTLFAQPSTPRCGSTLRELAPIQRQAWLERLASERFEAKALELLTLSNTLPLGWEEVLFRSLMRSFGLKANAETMVQLAERTPLQIIIKSRESQERLEAILLGQAGLIKAARGVEPPDDYLQQLEREYGFLRRKYSLSPLENSGWNFMRIRPPAFPTIRLAQLCALYHQQPQLMGRIVAITTLPELYELFTVSASPYWNTHYTLGHPSPEQSIKRAGKQLITSLIINTVIPFLYAWGAYTGHVSIMDRATVFLESLPAEDNATTRAFERQGVKCQNAYDSQALAQLAKRYCEPHQCALCPAGLEIMQRILGNG